MVAYQVWLFREVIVVAEVLNRTCGLRKNLLRKVRIADRMGF